MTWMKRYITKIKICGLTRSQDIHAVNTALPDYIGFVFAKSKRQIDERKAKELRNLLNPGIKVVGVFVNEDMNQILRLCNTHVIDIVQLHGDENDTYIKELRNYIPNEIIKAIRVKDSDDIRRALGTPSDYLLFDAYHEGQYGGIGKTFDWSLLSDVERPYFLAGGLRSDNIVQAVRQCIPYCIDVSSGVESGGYKDPEKILEMVAMVRNLVS